MTLREINTLVSSMGYQYRYSHFTETPTPPYIVYYYPAENDVYADGSNYVNRRQLFIELYTADKSFEAEAAIETKLTQAGLSWYKQTDFLNDEKLFQTTYETEVIING